MSADVAEEIGRWILRALAAVGKVLGISLGVMLTWTVIVASGAGLLFYGFRRRRPDPIAAAFVVAGSALVMAAWPFAFSKEGLLGRIAPSSAVPVVGKGLALQGAVLAVLLFIGAIVAVRTHRHATVVARADDTAEGS